MKESALQHRPHLPWWTWVVPLIIFAAGSEIAIIFKTLFGSSIFYLPLAFGIVLLHWWGPRVLLALYLNSLLFSSRFGVTLSAPLVATHIAVAGFVSWWLFQKIANGNCRLTNINDLIKFSVLGLMIPIVINSLYYPLVFHVSVPDIQSYWTHALLLWLADFSTCFALVIPILYFLTPVMDKLNLTTGHPFTPQPFRATSFLRLFTVDVLIVFGLLIVLGFSLDFKLYWFLFGICTLYLAVRHGFEIAIIGNLLIFVVVYVLPFIIHRPLDYTQLGENSIALVHMGMSLLYVSSALIGRVITDLTIHDTLMTNKNKVLEATNDELNKVNRELDRFVYSVSHDLSAPLKTIKGLVNISRLEPSPEKVRSYVELIDNRIDKLENFIGEVIDYSRSNRREIQFETIDLKQLLAEILELHSDLHSFPDTEFTKNLRVTTITSDRTLLRIILNNLLSNAIKYHRQDSKVKHLVSITSEHVGSEIILRISDNGEGIPLEFQNKIFNMFFRGTLTSHGSGLGLYIAREAATRIQGKISVISVHGEGSEFTVHLPANPI